MSLSDRKIRRYYYLAGFSLVVLVLVALGVPYVVNMKEEHETKIGQLSRGIVAEKKRYIRDTVYKTISDIESTRQSVVGEYTSVARRVALLLAALAADGRSLPAVLPSPGVDYAVIDERGKRILSTSLDEKTRQALTDEKSRAAFFARQAVHVAQSLGNGVRVHAFLAHARADAMAKERIRQQIHKALLPDDGYIWINHVIDYGGGDGYADRFVHPNMPESEGMLLSTRMTDIKGNLPYQVELEGVKAEGEIFSDYYFKKKNSDKIAHKLTFARLYKDFDWIVATGVYLDDVEELVARERIQMDATYVRQLGFFALVAVLVLVASVFVLALFERQIERMIRSFMDDIRRGRDELIVAKEKISEAYSQLEKVAYLDPLTGLINRRAMYDRINENVARSRRSGEGFCVVMADIDHFKRINDRYGHVCGDFALKQVARVLRSNIRAEDYVARWGGEEFLMAFASTGLEQALRLAEKLRRAVEESALVYQDNCLPITLTLGVAAFAENGNVEDMLNEADVMLYQGKKKSRNCVMPPPPVD